MILVPDINIYLVDIYVEFKQIFIKFSFFQYIYIYIHKILTLQNKIF